MKTQKVSALVLRKISYGERDAIVTFLTDEGKLMTGFAGGERVSQKRFGGVLDLFNQVRIITRAGKNGKMIHVTEAELLTGMDVLHHDLSKFAAGCFFCELILLFLKEDEISPKLYDSFFSFLRDLSDPNPFQDHFVPLMEHHFLNLFGFKPQLSACLQCGEGILPDKTYNFNPSRGGIECSVCDERFQMRKPGPLHQKSVSGARKVSKLPALDYETLCQILKGFEDSPQKWKEYRWRKNDVFQARAIFEHFIQYTAGRPMKSLGFLSRVLS